MKYTRPLRYSIIVLLLACSTPNLYSSNHSSLTFEERLRYQRAIESVYWNHRIWPKENQTEKPSFDKMMPYSIIKAKVEDYLYKSNALEVFWSKPITPKQLQIEMNRMAKESKRPAVLHELWQACDNDPYVIAECLVRPLLADRLLKDFYAYDKNFHSAIRSNALSEIHNRSTNQLKLLSGTYSETLLVQDAGIKRYDRDNRIDLDKQSWKEWNRKLHDVPFKNISPLKEDVSSFYIRSILKRTSNSIRFATVRWPKRNFQDWWNENRHVLSISFEAKSYQYVLNAISSNCMNDTWNSSQFPNERQGHTAVWTGSEMIIWGGGFGLDYFVTGSRYDPSTDTWTATTTDNVAIGRTYHTAVWTGSEMIIWGGYHFNSVSSLLNSGARYNPVTDTWTTTSVTNVPDAREFHTAVWTGSEMMIWGGDNIFDKFNTGGRYNPISDTWIPITTTNAPVVRTHHSAVWTGTEMIIWGGQGTGGVLETGGRYDPIADSWTATSTISAPIARDAQTAVWTGTKMIVWGGYATGLLDSGGSYDPILDSWQATSMTNAPIARTVHTAVWTGTEMIIWGGYAGPETNTGGKYSPSSDSWVPTTTTNAPKYRAFHSAVWTDTEMIVWGGTDGQNRLNSGGRYDPVSDSWISTAPLNIASGRTDHTSVWTGNEMIIWGGMDHSEYLNDGAAYNPAVDGWTTLSTLNVPSGRRKHTAIWTGTEMIVWGGDAFFSFDTGGKYNPSTDTWSSVTTINAPAARTQHTAIWTGSEMIVWGGFDAINGINNEGGRYNPSTDNWSNITNNNAPSPRADQTVIWTGNQMIIWGGWGCTDPPACTINDELNTGGRYDPQTDAWFATSSNNAPSARSAYTAVWSGNEMIIWGGADGFALSDGARYNPNADTWSAISNTNAPTARVLHTSVWTGQSMITWGGSGNDGIYLTDGGDYDPAIDSWNPISTFGAPLPRVYHKTVWTGDSMIVWGGFVPDKSNTYGIYCRDNNCPFINLDDTLSDGTQGVAYNGQIIATGGAAPYNYSVSNGSLPSGLTLDSATGEISGTPAISGTFDFVIFVTDSNDCNGSRNYSITINASCIFCDNFEDGVLDPNWSYLKLTWNEAAGLLSGTPVKKKAIAIASPAFAGCLLCYHEVALKTAGGLSNKIWIYGWYVDKKNAMELLVKEENDKIVLKQRLNGAIVAKNNSAININPQTIYIIRVTFDGILFSVSVNGTQLFTLTPVGSVPSGTTGFAVKNTTGSFDYVTIN
jgi:N-acetylneuraminic acid mutarotase